MAVNDGDDMGRDMRRQIGGCGEGEGRSMAIGGEETMGGCGGGGGRSNPGGYEKESALVVMMKVLKNIGDSEW